MGDCWEMSRDRPITSREVADRAGVSQSAVSLVLSGKGEGRVSPVRAEAIRAAAAELGYRPNAAARALRTGSARAVGLAVPMVTQPFFGFVLDGAQTEARKIGHAVMLIDAADGNADAYETLRAAGAIDGLLWFSGLPPETIRGGVPIVVVESEGRGLVSVRFAVEDGFRALGEHLRELGHSRVGYIKAGRDGLAFDRRGHGLAEQTFARRAGGLAEGLGFEPPLQVVTAVEIEAGREAAHRLLALEEPPTVIVGDDDIIATGAALAARDLGLDVPGDVSIAGMDDLALGRVLDPPLTTVRLDGARLGAVAFAALATELRGGRGPKRQRLDVELVLRGSTGPPSPRAGGRA